MKAHLAKLSLALLSTVFLLGCQDLGSEPVGPDVLGPEFAPGRGGGKGGGGKKGGAALADLTMEVGWSGAAVVSFKDGKKKIEFAYQGDGEFRWAAHMQTTHDAGIDKCVQGAQANEFTLAEKKLLFDQLIVGETRSPSNFFVRVDKTVLVDGEGESDDHRASVAWPNDVEPDEPEPTIKHFILRVGSFAELANVTVGGDIGKTEDPLTVVFTGGSVRLRAGRGSLADNFKLTCPNLDTVTMTLTSPPAD